MKRKLVVLMALLAGLSLAQTTLQATQSHTITVNVPPVVRLQLDATDYLFDFVSGTSGSVLGFPKASQVAYEAFLNELDPNVTTRLFAPTSVAINDPINGVTTNDYGTLRINTNQAQWTVKINTITGNLATPLENSRVKVHAVLNSGKGSSLTVTPSNTSATSLGANTNIIQAQSNGQGRSVYALYYFLEMNINDAFPSTNYSSNINVELILTAP